MLQWARCSYAIYSIRCLEFFQDFFTSAFCLFQLLLCILNLLIPLPIEFKREVHCKFLAAFCSRTDYSCMHCWCYRRGSAVATSACLWLVQTGGRLHSAQPCHFKHFAHCKPAYTAALRTRRRQDAADLELSIQWPLYSFCLLLLRVVNFKTEFWFYFYSK